MGLLVQPLHEAKAAGVVRRDLEVSDLQILFAMFKGVSEAAESWGMLQGRLRALELMLEGLTRAASG